MAHFLDMMDDEGYQWAELDAALLAPRAQDRICQAAGRLIRGILRF
jgi:hypothetical protein